MMAWELFPSFDRLNGALVGEVPVFSPAIRSSSQSIAVLSRPRHDRDSTRRRSTRLTVQPLESRQMMAADAPLGATINDTAEYLLGRVVVTPVFLDSTGNGHTKTENWTDGEIDAVLDKIIEGLDWWTDALATKTSVHSLEFLVDRTYADDPFEVDFEPIANRSNRHQEAVTDFLNHTGVAEQLSYHDAVRAFNHSQRIRPEYQADWAFSIFIADSSFDNSTGDGFFDTTGTFRGAFAYPGGRYIVMPSTRPAETVAHELGHIFWAFDEYPGGDSYAASRGYYNTPNSNASNNPEPEFVQEVSIMGGVSDIEDAFEQVVSPDVTFAHVGWQDSDGDGIFDVLDVPLHLSGSGAYDPERETFRFRGEASAVTLPNQNTVGTQSDITLNRVSRIEYRLEGQNDWTTIVAPQTSAVSFDVQFSVPEDFGSLELRVRDDRSGVTSPVITATQTTPAVPLAPLRGYVYAENESDLTSRSLDEDLLDGVMVHIEPAGGQAMPSGNLPADQQPAVDSLAPREGIAFKSGGERTTDLVRVQFDEEFSGIPMFAVEDIFRSRFTTRIDSDTVLAFDLDENSSHVEIDVIGLGFFDNNIARVEAYDSVGNLVARTTTDRSNDQDAKLIRNETQTLSVSDPENRIASIVVKGLDDTQIGVTAIRHGVATMVTTDRNGTFSFPALPAGEYVVTPQSESVVQAFNSQTITIDSVASPSVSLALAATRIDSLRHNTDLPEDVNGDGIVSALDALNVINELNFNDARELTWDDAGGFDIDVTNDGAVSALDALRVINRLNTEQPTQSSEPIASNTSLLVSAESVGDVVDPNSHSTDDDRLATHDQALAELAGTTNNLGVEAKTTG